MKAFWRLVVVVTALAFATGAAIAEATTYLNSSALRAQAMAQVFVPIGPARAIARILISADAIDVTVQGRQDDLEKWTVSRLNLLLFTQNLVSGPTPVVDHGVVNDPRGAYFGQNDIDLGRLDGIVSEAIAYAQMVRDPTVTSIEVARAVSILPTPAYGDIRWTVTLTTGRENATVWVNATGQVIGGDLSDTTRARDLDLFNTDTWPMAEAQAGLGRVLGGSAVHRISLRTKSIAVDADHPTDPDKQISYSWDLSGVRRGFGDIPNLIKLGMGDIATFPLAEVDLSQLPYVKAAARKAFNADGAVITEIEATKPTNRPTAGLPVIWTVDFHQLDGEDGEVLLDTAGNVLEVHLPESRMPAAQFWLAPATLATTLKRIETAFGRDAKIFEISIDDEKATLEIEDPQQKAQLAKFIVDAKEIFKFGTASFTADLSPEHVFTMANLTPLTEDRFGAFAERTLQRINMEGAAVYRYTISRQVLIMDPADTRLLVEVRAGKDNGNQGGWVTYTLEGEEADVMLP